MESCPVCGAQFESWLDIMNHSCSTGPACSLSVHQQQEQDPMIPVWAHRDSSETIREHVRDSAHQPSFYMLPDLSDVLCSEDDDALSSEDHGPEHQKPCVSCTRHADVRFLCANERMCYNCCESRSACTCSRGSSCAMHYVVLGDHFDELVPTPVLMTMPSAHGLHNLMNPVPDVPQNPGYRLRTVRAGWKQTMQVYMCFLLNDMFPQTMKLCMEGANTKEHLFGECILSIAGVHRQIVIT